MTTKFKTKLKEYLPEYQKGNKVLDDFLDATGEILDGFREAIDKTQFNNDFQLVDSTLLDSLAGEFDVEFPRNMSDSRKRSYLRDIIALYRSKGTTPSFRRIFRIIGWEVEITEYYIISPQTFPSGSYTIKNEFGAQYTLSQYDRLSESQLVYKNSQVFVDLKDPLGNIYKNQQIHGQRYEVDNPIKFTKVPYIKIIVNSEDFDIFTSPYTEGGKVYSYESSEEFEILTAIQDYFIERTRPAAVAIIDIATPFNLDDTITTKLLDVTGAGKVVDNIDYTASNELILPAGGSCVGLGFRNGDYINITSNSGNNDGRHRILSLNGNKATLYTTTQLTQESSVLSTITSESFGIMTSSDKLPKYDGTISYGTTVDRYICGEQFGGFKYGSSDFLYYGVDDTPPDEDFTLTYSPNSPVSLADAPVIPIRCNTNLTINVPIGVSVGVYASTDDLFDITGGVYNSQNLGTYSTTGAYTLNLLNYRAFQLVFFTTNGTQTTVDVSLR